MTAPTDKFEPIPAEQHPAAPASDHPGHDEPMPEGEEAAPPGTLAMAIVRWLLIAAMAGLAGWAIHHAFFANAGVAHAAEKWQCPMHPSVIQDHPGDCPICGMSLVKLEAQPAPKAAAAGAEAQGGSITELLPEHEGHRHNPADPYYCPMHPEETGQEASFRCPVCKMKPTRRAEPGAAMPEGHEGHRHDPADLYYCSMHPEETGQDPSWRCPICKMKPDKRVSPAGGAAQGEAAGHRSEHKGVPGLVPVELGQDRIQLAGVKTAPVTREKLTSELKTVGTVAASEKAVSRVQTRFSGWIETLQVAQTGEKVTKGQVLATIYSPELLAAQQEYLNARRWSAQGGAGAAPNALSSNLAADARGKLELLGISAQEIEEIERSGKPQRAIALRSPASGYVVQKSAVQGVYVQPGAELFTVADLSTVWVLADVYESEIGRVKEGQPANLALAAYPGEAFKGKVQFIYPSLSTDTRTLTVRLALKNPGLKLKPGMYGDVTVELGSQEGLLVPREAVVDTGEDRYVFVSQGEGRFEPRAVVLGARAGERVQVLEGLDEGERVVTTANFLVDSESRLRAAIEGMGKAATRHEGHLAEGEGR